MECEFIKIDFIGLEFKENNPYNTSLDEVFEDCDEYQITDTSPSVAVRKGRASTYDEWGMESRDSTSEDSIIIDNGEGGFGNVQYLLKGGQCD